MAIRPVVLVFQEFASPTVTTTTPDLNNLIVGPAYWIQDYFQPGTTTPADKSSIKLGTDYGALEGDPTVATPTGPDVIQTPDAPNNVAGALLDSASVAIFFDQARVVITNGVNGTTSNSTPNQFDVSDAVDFTTGATKVLPGDRIGIKDGSSDVIWRTVLSVDTATQLHFTQDIPVAGFTPGSGQSWRIERQVNDATIGGSFFSVSGNEISIDGSITLVVPTQGAKTVSYAKVYVQYRSLRQDLQQLDVIFSEDDIKAKIGRIDARNPLAVGCFVSLQNTTTQVQFFGVASNDLQGHVACRDSIGSDPTVYAIVPLTSDVSVIAMWNSDNVGLALPDETRGRPQRFRVVLGSGTLPVTKNIIDPQATGKTVSATGTAPALNTQLTIPGIDLIAGGVLPGDKVDITVDAAGTTRLGTYPIAQVISATVLEVDPSTPIPGGVQSANATLAIKTPTNTDRIASAAYTNVATAATDDLYLILNDPNGTFISSDVIPGDTVEMPSDPTTNDFTTVSKFVVASVQSENRLTIVNNGQNTSTVENELPHGVKRIGGALVPTSATLNYRVTRKLSKTQQVTELVALAQSFMSRRTILVWPDKVDVAGVTGGKGQPGYYLACAVGGMTAGLPPHQGFTFLGIAGVSQIYDSNTYFNDSQLTDLSNGGWYVFKQDTTSSLPYTIHQLTTDVTTLETGEYSVVKNFDFVAVFFVDILQEFLGRYNVTPEALPFIRAAMTTGGDTLKLRTYAKIGAPLTSFQINDLLISPVSADRVVTHVGVGLPKPLNVIELHLVA